MPAEFEPYQPLDRPSTTSRSGDGIIEPPRRSRSAQRRRQATPLPAARLYGLLAPVNVRLRRLRAGALWIEVSDHRGRFYVQGDCTIWALMQQLIEGGHWVVDQEAPRRRRRRGQEPE